MGMQQNTVVVLSPEEAMRLTMIVTDGDRDEALAFLTEIEKRMRIERQGHCEPRFGER
jgi:hypothetical protein